MTYREKTKIESWWRSKEPIDGLEVMWLGQAGFLLRTGDIRIIIDPYLSDSLAKKYRGKEFPHTRMMAVPIAPDALGEADLVLITHDHTDHMDPETIAPLCAAGDRATVLVPRYSRAVALERGVPTERLVTLNDRESRRTEQGITVWAIPAAHETVQRDDAGNARFLGYLIRIGEYLVYHSGDTVPCEDLESRLVELRDATGRRVDLALLPVNGRDEKRRSRGVPGNLTINEAIAYHRSLSFRNTIVHHFGMFDFNTADPRELREACRKHNLTGGITVPEMNALYSVGRASGPSAGHLGRER